jgi:hypothetical protein
MPKLNPGSNKCLCRECGLYFGSVHAFDRHRVGGCNDRRCLALPTLLESGWAEGTDGFLRTPGKKETENE